MSEPMTFLRANRIWLNEMGQPGAAERAEANFAQAAIDEPEMERRAAERKREELERLIDSRIESRLRELGLIQEGR